MRSAHARDDPDALFKYGNRTNTNVMEEKLMMQRGFVKLDSSELPIRGGTSTFEKIFSKIKSLINFIADYIPKFIKGLQEGFAIF